MSDGTGRQAMAAQSGTSDNPKSSNQESSKKPKTLGKYLLVSATQTIVEFGSFTLLHVLSVPSAIANGVAIVLSASYNFLMNRNVTFKSSSNFGRSVALFMLLWVWNYLFGSIMLAWLPSAFGWNAVLVKFLTMACQFAWGYPCLLYTSPSPRD